MRLVDSEGKGVTEEKVEYRDEEGNLLDEAQVKALEGKVSFSTRYETRTRLVDELGNEVAEGIVGEGGEDGEGFAGTSAGGVDPETVGEGVARTVPADVGEGRVEKDVQKERSVVGSAERGAAEPESEVGRETGRDEL